MLARCTFGVPHKITSITHARKDRHAEKNLDNNIRFNQPLSTY